MKEIGELLIPEDVRYTADHEWARLEGDRVRVGITDYAQDQLGDVVYVELPRAGASFERGSVFGVVESVKAVSDLLMPVEGEILEVNASLAESPQLVNLSPYGEGWMVVVRAASPAAWNRLLDRDEYLGLLRERG